MKKKKTWEFLIRVIQYRTQWEARKACVKHHVTSHIYVFRPATDLSDILKFEERERF